MGDNDFSVEHTGVRVRQMAGTLERVVKNDAVAFQKAWDFLASSDDEDNFFFFFFSSNYFPRKGRKIWPFLERLFFCSRWPMQGNELRKRRRKIQLKNVKAFEKIIAEGIGHGQGINITPQTYGTEEVHMIFTS